MADNFIVNPSSVSFSAILEDLDAFLDAAPDSAKWKDFFASSTGTLVKQLIAGLGTFLSYNTTTARREGFITYAQNRSSVVAAGETLGYSSYRGNNAVLELDIVPNVTTVWPKWTVIGTIKDKDLILTEQTVVNAGVPITVQAIIGEVKSSELTAADQNPASFRFKEPLVSQDIRVYLNSVEVSTSERILDLINEKFVIQSNVYDSVNVLYLNLDTFSVRYNTGGIIRIDWIERSNISFTVSDAGFLFGVLTETRIASVFVDVEDIETVRVNAPLFNETQFVVRGRDDYLKIFKLSDTSIISASGEDVTPAVVRLYYIRTALRLFTSTEKAALVTKLSTYRPFGMEPPLISDPTIVFLALKITVTLTGTGNIDDDVNTILQSYARILEQELDFKVIEEDIETLDYVRVARIDYDYDTWAAKTTYRRGQMVVPTSPTLLQEGFVYEAGGKIYKSGPTEPEWPAVADAEVDDSIPILASGVRASSKHGDDVFCAANPGLSGNFITLVFDGFTTNKDIIDAWNELHPGNPVLLCSGDLNNINTAGTLVIGRDAGELESGVLPAGGTVGSNSSAGAEPSGDDSGVGGVGTGFVWTVQDTDGGIHPEWQPGVQYSLGSVVKPSAAAVLANPLLANYMFEVTGFVNKSNKDVTSTTAQVSYSGVDFVSCNPGLIGNNISLTFDGIKTVSQVVADWNVANPDNTVCFFPSSSGGDIPAVATIVASGGGGTQSTEDDSGTTFVSTSIGEDGNLIELDFDGISSIGSVVDGWNLQNPNNQVIFYPLANSGNVPTAQVITLTGGSSKVNKEPSWPVGPVVC